MALSPVAVSVVIPAYNERDRLPLTLETLLRFAQQQDERWEILVADDGSSDGMTENLAPRFPDVRFLRAVRNQGKGAAVRRGMLATHGELALFTDADLSTPIEELPALRRAIEQEGYDIAIASRGLEASRLEVRQPWWREFSGRAFNALVRPLSGLPFKDTQCGFKLFRRAAAHAVFGRTRCQGWAFDVEALMVAEDLGYRVKEVPVTWRNSEGSKVKFMNAAPHMAADILRFRWWRFNGLYEKNASSSSEKH